MKKCIHPVTLQACIAYPMQQEFCASFTYQPSFISYLDLEKPTIWLETADVELYRWIHFHRWCADQHCLSIPYSSSVGLITCAVNDCRLGSPHNITSRFKFLFFLVEKDAKCRIRTADLPSANTALPFAFFISTYLYLRGKKQKKNMLFWKTVFYLAIDIEKPALIVGLYS